MEQHSVNLVNCDLLVYTCSSGGGNLQPSFTARITIKRDSDGGANMWDPVMTGVERLVDETSELIANSDCREFATATRYAVILALFHQLSHAFNILSCLLSELENRWISQEGSLLAGLYNPSEPTVGTVKTDVSLKSGQPYGCPGAADPSPNHKYAPRVLSVQPPARASRVNHTVGPGGSAGGLMYGVPQPPKLFHLQTSLNYLVGMRSESSGPDIGIAVDFARQNLGGKAITSILHLASIQAISIFYAKKCLNDYV
ncbi:hypothetical protein J6590_013299 [Homalodisca vitripennis]|nr:hypothetical protein J6590_013299 [Homalodisca vitripennis]